MLVLTHDTLRNPAILETTVVPRKFLGRVLPRMREARFGQRMRLVMEVQFLRFMVALVPFCVPMLIWPQSAAPISQAPLAMLLLIGVSETYILRMSKRQRERLMTEEAAEAALDTFRFRAAAVLRKIAARQGIEAGQLKLVVEQSDMARVTPLSFVTVQSELPKPHVVPLDAGDRALLDALFDDSFTERDLQRAGLRLDRMLHVAAIEARSVSAHARLAAALEQDKTAAPA
jgi:hypothetical protein